MAKAFGRFLLTQCKGRKLRRNVLIAMRVWVVIVSTLGASVLLPTACRACAGAAAFGFHINGAHIIGLVIGVLIATKIKKGK